MRQLTDYQGLFNSTNADPPEGHGAFDEAQNTDPCDTCEIKDKSACCGADIICGDLCDDCVEHTDSACEKCDFNPKITENVCDDCYSDPDYIEILTRKNIKKIEILG